MTTTFRALDGPRRPVRVALVGAGGWGTTWLDTLARTPAVQVAALVDLDLHRAADLARERALDVPIVASVGAANECADLDAVINATVPDAHLPVALDALGCGLHVLGEKPLAGTLPDALALVDAAAATDRLVMVSQSRRYNHHVSALKAGVAALGGIGMLTTDFFRAPHFGGFREKMAHPLLRDMAIHPFDTARYLLDAEPLSVTCEEFNPAWSWYLGAAMTVAHFTMTEGAHYVYTGSWCSSGSETSWNGQWRVSAEWGSATWDGERMPLVNDVVLPVTRDVQPEGLDGALASFVDALWTGTAPLGEVHENLGSFLMVEAAVAASQSGTRVDVQDFVRTARAQARA